MCNKLSFISQGQLLLAGITDDQSRGLLDLDLHEKPLWRACCCDVYKCAML